MERGTPMHAPVRPVYESFRGLLSRFSKHLRCLMIALFEILAEQLKPIRQINRYVLKR